MLYFFNLLSEIFVQQLADLSFQTEDIKTAMRNPEWRCFHTFWSIYKNKVLQHKIVEQINPNDCTPYIGLWLWCSTPVSVTSISWRSGLLVEETGAPGEDHRSAESHWQTLKHKDVSNRPCLSGIRTHNVSGDFIYSYKSNNHAITNATIAFGHLDIAYVRVSCEWK